MGAMTKVSVWLPKDKVSPSLTVNFSHSINAVLVVSGKILADGSIADNVLDGTIASVCGIQSLQMGVFGGIIVGLGVAALHNRYHKIVLPSALSFFGGSRFVPIISTVVYVGVGILMYFIWPAVQNGIFALGGLVTGTGYFGTLVFGIIKRAEQSAVCLWQCRWVLHAVSFQMKPDLVVRRLRRQPGR